MLCSCRGVLAKLMHGHGAKAHVHTLARFSLVIFVTFHFSDWRNPTTFQSDANEFFRTQCDSCFSQLFSLQSSVSPMFVDSPDLAVIYILFTHACIHLLSTD